MTPYWNSICLFLNRIPSSSVGFFWRFQREQDHRESILVSKGSSPMALWTSANTDSYRYGIGFRLGKFIIAAPMPLSVEIARPIRGYHAVDLSDITHSRRFSWGSVALKLESLLLGER